MVDFGAAKDYSHDTMVKKIAAGKFKAQCLALLDEVAETGSQIVITKRGKPLARLIPFKEPPGLRGSILFQKDVVSPIGVKWDVLS